MQRKPPPARRPRPKRPAKRFPKQPQLRLTPYVWAKLRHLRDAGPTEIGGFGVSAVSDPLLIEDFQLVPQQADWGSVVFDDEAIADYFDKQADAGLPPQRVGRVWVHTHPGPSPLPSGTDEETFARVFGECSQAVMLILAQEDNTYARLRLAIGSGVEIKLKVHIAYEQAFPAADHTAWDAEYAACVTPTGVEEAEPLGLFKDATFDDSAAADYLTAADDTLSDFASLAASEGSVS